MTRKEKKYRLTVGESQLHMIAACVEDCSRFMSGQAELCNCTSMLDYMHEAHEAFRRTIFRTAGRVPLQYHRSCSRSGQYTERFGRGD